MMQLRVVRGVSGRVKELSKRGVCSVSQGSGDTQGYVPLPTNRTADPAVHSSDPQADVKGESNPQGPTEYEMGTTKPPIASSPKLTHTEVGLPSKPNATQKRKAQTQARVQPQPEVLELTCVGGFPWPDDKIGQEAQKKAQEADNKEYFKDHKASPISEIEFADSRKPITQATDTIRVDKGITFFTVEQRDTAEQSLLRAAEIWKWNKIRGDPDSPHGRVLRQLRGEFW
ncbi:hypothetical protein vseg_013405 [Gypsophila vaccaria]